MSKFEPTKNEKTVISIRIDKEQLNIIDEISKRIDISRNEVINQCLEYAINNSDFKDINKYINENSQNGLFFCYNKYKR